MILDSLLAEEDRLVCVIATSGLTDEDRSALVDLYGEDNIEYVSVRYPGAKKSRKLINYARGVAAIEATFSAGGSSKIPTKISVDDLDQFCRQFPGVWFDCIDATARAFDEVSPSMDEDFAVTTYNVGIMTDAIVVSSEVLFLTPHTQKSVCNLIARRLYDNFSRYVEEVSSDGKTKCVLYVKTVSSEPE
jgi:hypothetical protein